MDYTLSAEALTFARGATAQTVTVTALADQVAGDNEFVDLGFGTLPDEESWRAARRRRRC